MVSVHVISKKVTDNTAINLNKNCALHAATVVHYNYYTHALHIHHASRSWTCTLSNTRKLSVEAHKWARNTVHTEPQAQEQPQGIDIYIYRYIHIYSKGLLYKFMRRCATRLASVLINIVNRMASSQIYPTWRRDGCNVSFANRDKTNGIRTTQRL